MAGEEEGSSPEAFHVKQEWGRAMQQHVIPVGDVNPHVPEEWCPCGPERKVCGAVVVHNAWDNREMVEGAYEILGYGAPAGDGWERRTVEA